MWVHARFKLICAACSSGDGSLLTVVVSGNNEVAIWNNSGKLVCRLSDRSWRNISCIEWSPLVRNYTMCCDLPRPVYGQ